MDRITSFTINHLVLEPGLYVSRRDEKNGVVVTTFDLRITAPNKEPVIDSPALHAIEHLAATFLRNSKQKEDIVYFGPMGCQTGFYLLVRDENDYKILDVIKDVLTKIVNHKGEIFGNTREECGNYRNLNLEAAQIEAKRYLDVLNSKEVTFKYE